MAIHGMIDLETLSVEPDAVVRTCASDTDRDQKTI